KPVRRSAKSGEWLAPRRRQAANAWTRSTHGDATVWLRLRRLHAVGHRQLPAPGMGAGRNPRRARRGTAEEHLPLRRKHPEPGEARDEVRPPEYERTLRARLLHEQELAELAAEQRANVDTKRFLPMAAPPNVGERYAVGPS